MIYIQLWGMIFKDTLITDQTDSIPSTPLLRCLLGNTTSLAKVISSKVLQCIAPAAQSFHQKLVIFIISDGHEIMSKS